MQLPRDFICPDKGSGMNRNFNIAESGWNNRYVNHGCILCLEKCINQYNHSVK